MSKSLGNFYYARDIVKLYGTEAVRYFYLSRHWRKPLDFSIEALEEAQKAVERVYKFLTDVELVGGEVVPPQEFSEQLASLRIKFEEELENDFNTAGALAVLQEMVNLARRCEATGLDRRALLGVAKLIRNLSEPLGLFQKERVPTVSRRTEELIGLLVELRAALRKERNFRLADEIRAKLAALGVELKDTPQGTVWTLR